MMLKYRSWIVLVFGLIIMGACKDEEVGIPEVVKPQIKNLHASSQMKGVLLSWENPEDRLYDKVEISYIIEGEKMIVKETIEEQYSAVSIELPTADVYKFHVYGISSIDGKTVVESTVKSRVLVPVEPEDELIDILNSIGIYGGDNGVRVLWKNQEDLQALIRLEYDGQIHEINANSLNKEYTIGGLELNRSYNFAVSLVYQGEVGTETRTLSATALEKAYRRMENDGWTILASSQQAAQPATNLLDNDPKTYWRSDAKITTATPQYIIVDFKRKINLSALTLVRKYGDGENSAWDVNISTSEDGVTYTTPYRYFTQASQNPDPNSIFYVEFNRTVDGEQMYQLPHTHKARYVRIDFVRGSAFAVFGDINFYGE